MAVIGGFDKTNMSIEPSRAASSKIWSVDSMVVLLEVEAQRRVNVQGISSGNATRAQMTLRCPTRRWMDRAFRLSDALSPSALTHSWATVEGPSAFASRDHDYT